MTSYKPGHYKKQNRIVAWWQRVKVLAASIFSRRSKHTSSPVQLGAYGNKQDRSAKVFFTKNFSTAFLLILGVAFLWGGYTFLASSDVFRLDTINVRGTLFVQRQDVLQVGSLEPGISLLKLKNKNLQEQITALPWVEKVTVEKQWPSTLYIQVKEQKPIALVNVEKEEGINQLFYVNRKGQLFAPYALGQDLDFPVLTGKKWKANEQKLQLSSSGAQGSALLLLKLAAKGNPILPIQSISEVHMSDKNGIIVYLVDQPFPIYFGTESIYTKYYRLVKILERLYRKKTIEGIKSIRMDYSKDKILVARAEINK